jgi:hypothetical protein
MLLNDMFGFFRRNISKMNNDDKKKVHKELKRIMSILEKDMRGDGSHVG